MARRFSWKSDGRATWPLWKAVTAVELGLAILVITVMASIFLLESQRVMAHARVAEVVMATTFGRIAVVEHLAVTGRLLETDIAGQTRTVDAPDAPEYEKHLSAALAFAAVAAASGQAPSQSSSRGDSSPHQLRSGVRDGSVLVMGRVAELPQPFTFVLSPAVATGEEGATVQWLCGNAPAPPGSALPTHRLRSDMPSDLLPNPCRGATHP